MPPDYLKLPAKESCYKPKPTRVPLFAAIRVYYLFPLSLFINRELRKSPLIISSQVYYFFD